MSARALTHLHGIQDVGSNYEGGQGYTRLRVCKLNAAVCTQCVVRGLHEFYNYTNSFLSLIYLHLVPSELSHGHRL